MDMIDGENPDLVRALAAQGFAAEDIAGMTRTDLAFVRKVLAEQPAEQESGGPVNTTPRS